MHQRTSTHSAMKDAYASKVDSETTAVHKPPLKSGANRDKKTVKKLASSRSNEHDSDVAKQNKKNDKKDKSSRKGQQFRRA